MQKIDLMIVGAQKAGSTSLKNYLNEHPQIIGHPQTEFSYFRDVREYENGFENAFKKFFTTTNSKNYKKVIAKSVGIYNNEIAIKRLHDHNPDCKLVLLVRHPVDRAYSSYTMEVNNAWLKKDFNSIVEIIENKEYDDKMYRFFIRLGLYSNHLKMIYKYFPKDSVKLYKFEDFTNRTNEICFEIFEWLNLDTSFVPNVNRVYNKTRKVKSELFSQILSKIKAENNVIKKLAKSILPYSTFTKIGNTLIEANASHNIYEPMDQETRNFLIRYFKPYNDELFKLNELDLQEWNY